MHRSVLQLGGAVLLLAAVAGAACNERETVNDAGSQPVAATAYPLTSSVNPTLGPVPVAKNAPEDIQRLQITIVNGEFDSDVYDAQRRPTRLIVTARGGPYILSIDELMAPREVPANTTTELDLNLPEVGEFPLRVIGRTEETAILNVRLIGGR